MFNLVFRVPVSQCTDSLDVVSQRVLAIPRPSVDAHHDPLMREDFGLKEDCDSCSNPIFRLCFKIFHKKWHKSTAQQGYRKFEKNRTA